MTRQQIVADLIKCYKETLPDDPDLGYATFIGFRDWAWPDDEPLRTYGIDRDEYNDCLREAYNAVHA